MWFAVELCGASRAHGEGSGGEVWPSLVTATTHTPGPPMIWPDYDNHQQPLNCWVDLTIQREVFMTK